MPNIKSVTDVDDSFFHKRMEQIIAFEQHLIENGTIILKFFLHLSKSEQKKRLLRRLDLPEKNWKFSAGDLKERKLWGQYMEAYKDMLSRTSTSIAPWHIIPADDKASARLLVAKAIVTALSKFHFQYPILAETEKNALKKYRTDLEND